MLQQQRYSAAVLTILLHLGGSLLFTAGGLFLVRLLHHPAVCKQPRARTLYFALALRSICIYICEHY